MIRFVAAFSTLAVLTACATQGAQSAETPSAPEAAVSEGRVRGQWEDGFAIFKGMPYAASTAGEWRWRPPQPAAHWQGVRDATAYGPNCWQPTEQTPAPEMSEDCLSINVWTPRMGADAHLPVMVWIHGGAFFVGSGQMPEGINELSRRNVVFVTLNYRLGRLGFFAHPDEARQHPDEPVGNYWLMDQIAALKWVQANIAAFGGDPGNVTIFGISAGGSSVNSLVASPAARGLVRRAIAQSGGGLFNASRPLARAQTEAQEYASRHGAGTTLDQLRALTPQQILAAERGPPDFGAIVDGRLLPDELPFLFARNEINPVDYIVGATSDEASIYGLMGFDAAMMEQRFGVRLADFRPAYTPGISDADLLRELQTDFIFASAVDAMARFHSKSGRPTFAYRFAYIAEGRRGEWRGVPHGGDGPYLFGLDLRNRPNAPAPTERDRRTAAMVEDYWTNFAKAGDPNGAGLPEWPRYAPPAPKTLVIADDTGAVADFRKAQIGAFHAFFTRQTGVPIER